MNSENTAEFVPLIDFEKDYEIMCEYPFTIRRVSDHYEISESFVTGGYIRVNLNNQSYRKHILIAKQFIPNDDPVNKTQVDHINRDPSDYHLSNLRWVSQSQNNENRSSHKGVEYEYVDDLPLDVEPIILYKGWEFESYFMDSDGYVWYDNGVQFRKLYIDNRNTINMIDIYHKRHRIGINGLRREFM